jgi:hypothetical protein
VHEIVESAIFHSISPPEHSQPGRPSVSGGMISVARFPAILIAGWMGARAGVGRDDLLVGFRRDT